MSKYFLPHWYPLHGNRSMSPRNVCFKIFVGVLFWGILFSHQTLAAEDPDALYEQGRFAEAEKAYAEADMDHPKDIRYRFNRGCAAFQNGDFQEATAAFSSVLRRAEEDEMRFKSLYNLGNTAFKQGDFERAADLYRRAISYHPQSDDAKYNLELALRELERLKQQEEQNQETPSQGERGQQEDQQHHRDQKDDGPDRLPSKEGSQEQPPQEPSQGQERPQDKGREEAEEETSSAQTNKAEQEHGKAAGQKPPQDLSGELKAMGGVPPEQVDEEAPGAAMSMVDKKRAEALLDNVEENPARFLQFQMPKGKRNGVSSGRDW
jgi:Ca-activated chloride channel family protein